MLMIYSYIQVNRDFRKSAVKARVEGKCLHDKRKYLCYNPEDMGGNESKENAYELIPIEREIYLLT